MQEAPIASRGAKAGRSADSVLLLVHGFGAVVLTWLLLAPPCSAAQAILKPDLGSEQRPESIHRLVEKANRGDPQAQYDLAVYFAARRSGGLASSEAVRWLRLAAERGHIEAQSDLGLLYYRGAGVPRDLTEAARWLRRASEQGHAAAQADLGRLHFLGHGVPRDHERAAQWYRKAAEQGFAPAQFNLAGLYASGIGVSRDHERAVRWYREAADGGLAEAQHALARALIRGEGVDRDLAAAARWLRAAAAQGLADAQFLLATHYERGLGVGRDLGRALGWYLSAADQGSADAQRALGSFYREGRSGTKDLVRGQMWLILAARNAPEAVRVRIERERDESGQRLTAVQAAKAEQLANQWRRKTWAELQARSPGELIPMARSQSNDLRQFFRVAGRNIAAAQSEYDKYWKPHIGQSRSGILEAVRLVREPGAALVLGAGQCREIPLEQLARTFDRVVLVDLDEASMSSAVERLPGPLRRRIEIRVSDVTSFAAPLMQATALIVERSQSANQAFTELEALYSAIESIRRFPDLPQADLVVSSLVLSELARYPSTYTAQLVKEKFGKDLAEWRGYGTLWRKLRSFASEDHAEMLARLGAPGAIVYFADTVGRGPDLTRVGSDKRRQAQQAIASRFARIGLFNVLQSQPEPRNLLFSAFEEEALGGTDAGSGADRSSAEALGPLIAGIEKADGALPEGADRAARAASRLLCQDRLPVELEIAAIESILDAYRAVEPQAFEELLDWDAFLAILNGRDFVATGASWGWKWLEYACQIPRRPGGFWVRGTVLRIPSEE